ncbi:hypothetical protein [Emticicia soli]|uniref:Uncharacterized protein n=1 Tax=Emticicia soli TaxID=2027878 RepID=A0ABW5J3P5_9BACT
MDKEDKDKKEPLFPPPFESFEEELAPEIKKLQESTKMYEYNKLELEKSQAELKNVSFFHADFLNKEATVNYYHKNMKVAEKEMNASREKTYGRMQRVFDEHEVDPETAKRVIDVLDQKVYPEKYENRTPNEDKGITEDKTQIEVKGEQLNSPSENRESQANEDKAVTDDKKNRGVKGEWLDPFTENQGDLTNNAEKDKLPAKNDYSLSLIQQKREQQKIQEAKIAEKDNPNEKSNTIEKDSFSVPGSQNYQLKFHKPVYRNFDKDNSSKDNKDKSPDKE